jgi:hypothetical protein
MPMYQGFLLTLGRVDTKAIFFFTEMRQNTHIEKHTYLKPDDFHKLKLLYN